MQTKRAESENIVSFVISGISTGMRVVYERERIVITEENRVGFLTITNRRNQKFDPILPVKNLLESFAKVERFPLTYNPAYPLVVVCHGPRRPPWSRAPLQPEDVRQLRRIWIIYDVNKTTTEYRWSGCELLSLLRVYSAKGGEGGGWFLKSPLTVTIALELSIRTRGADSPPPLSSSLQNYQSTNPSPPSPPRVARIYAPRLQLRRPSLSARMCIYCTYDLPSPSLFLSSVTLSDVRPPRRGVATPRSLPNTRYSPGVATRHDRVSPARVVSIDSLVKDNYYM